MSLSATLVTARPPSAPLTIMVSPVSARRPPNLTVMTNASSRTNIIVESSHDLIGDDSAAAAHRSELILTDDDVHDAEDDSADDNASKLVMTPMPRRRAMSPLDIRHAPHSAGLMPSQIATHRPSLPSRQGLVLGAPGARISVVRNEKKALGLKAAVGNFRRRTTSNSFAEQPFSCDPVSSPECSEASHITPSVSMAPRSAIIGGSQLEARRQALAIVTQGVGHRRISSAEQIRTTHSRPTFPVPSSRSMPSLDQIQGWAAQRKAATAQAPRERQSRPVSLHMTHTASLYSRAVPPLAVDNGDFANNSDAIILACEGNIRRPPMLVPRTPCLSPSLSSSPRDDKDTPLSTPDVGSWLTSSASGHTKPTTTTTATIASHSYCVPRIQFDPASAIQAGEEAVSFAKLLLEATTTTTTPSSSQPISMNRS